MVQLWAVFGNKKKTAFGKIKKILYISREAAEKPAKTRAYVQVEGGDIAKQLKTKSAKNAPPPKKMQQQIQIKHYNKEHSI